VSTLAALGAIVLVWDVFLAGQMAQFRGTPRLLAALSGLAALVAAPALVIAVASSSITNGRSVAGIAWIWPATVAVFVAQALYATTRRLVSPLISVPIAAYNLLLMAIAATRYVGAIGGSPPTWALALSGAHATALGAIAGTAALASPFAILVPLVAPAFPGRWRLSSTVRVLLAAQAAVWVGATIRWVPSATAAVRSYDRFGTQSLQERPAGDFAVGVRVLAPIDAAPPPLELRNDLALVDTTGAEVVSVIVTPAGATRAVLDSLARVLDPLRRDSTTLVVALGYDDDAARQYERSPATYDSARVADVQRIARRLHPDYLLPADEPYGRGARALGRLPVSAWTRYLTDAARAAHAVDPHIKVAVAASALDARDSALYQWAAAAGSPLDAVGFTLFPAFGGGASLDTNFRTADRWMHRLATPTKEQWVFAAGGYPGVHGEDAQENAVWGALVWGTSRGAIKGVIVADAADYDEVTGLRAASGRLRPAADVVMRAVRQLRANGH
jgi:hypothetical protein